LVSSWFAEEESRKHEEEKRKETDPESDDARDEMFTENAAGKASWW